MLKFRIEKSVLAAAAKACAGIVSKSGVSALYESLHIRGMPGQPIEFSATDLETGIILRATAIVEESGLAVLPAAALASIASKLPDGEVRIEVDAETWRGTVKAGRGKFSLAGYSPKDFPELPAPGDSAPLVLPAAKLAKALGRVAHAASKERMRFAMTGVLFASKGGTVEFVATDGKRLALDSIDAAGGPEFSAIVGSAGVDQIVRIAEAAGEAGTIAISAARNHVFAATERESVVTRVVEGSFPNYRDVLPKPKDEKARATFVRAEMIAALERAQLVESAEDSIRIETLEDGLLVAALSPEREMSEPVAADRGGEAVRMGFGAGFLLDALRAAEDEHATIIFNGPSWPIVMREGAMVQIVMPRTVDEAKAK